MAIQHSISQDNGAVATYHVVTRIAAEFDTPNAAQATVVSYADADHSNDKAPPITSINADISALLGVPAPSPSGNFGPQIVDVVEKYLLTTDQFSGGTQVS